MSAHVNQVCQANLSIYIEVWQHFDSARERVLADPLGVDAETLSTVSFCHLSPRFS